MAERELKRLNRRELLQMLLVQCEESERLQEELDEIQKQFDTMSESYERLKLKLNLKDERLNQKDLQIQELTAEAETLKNEMEELKRTGMAGPAAEAADRIGEIFREAQRAAEEYLAGIRKEPEAAGDKQIPFDPGKTAGPKKKQEGSRPGQVVQMVSGQAKSAAGRKPAEGAQTADGSVTEFVSLDMAAGSIYG